MDAEEPFSSRRVLEQVGTGPGLRLEEVSHPYGWLARHLPTRPGPCGR